MKSNELKIGNLVLFAGLVNEISVVGKQRVQFETGGGNVFELHHISGIPLTPEWLERFGFEFRNGAYYHSKYNKLHVNISNPISIWLGNANGILVPMDYLHQLQNAFYVLTAQELTPNK